MGRLVGVACRLLVIIAPVGVVSGGEPAGSSFTYQGQIQEAGVPLNGDVDLRFELFDAAEGGNSVGSLVQVQHVSVAKGMFSVGLDFGDAVFTGEARWAQIEVRNPHDPTDSEPFTPLSPRQPLTSVPYALHSFAPWKQDGTDVSYQGGNVGIGTTTPRHALHLDLSPGVNDGILLAKEGTFHGTRLAVRGSNNAIFGIDIDPNNVDAGFEQFEVTYDGDTPVLVIDNRGEVGIGTSAPEVPLHIEGGTDARLSDGGYIQAGDTSGLNLVIDENEIMARDGGGVSNLHLNNDGGTVIVGGGLQVIGESSIDLGYEVVTSTREGSSFSTAACPPGKHVMGGGCTSSNSADPLKWSHPNEEGTTWRCFFDQGVVGDADVTAWAICVNIR